MFWEHRNIFGAGERFRAEIAASELQQSLTASLNKPDFLRVRQSLLADATPSASASKLTTATPSAPA